MQIKGLFDKTFGPPAEGIKLVREITSGETGKNLDRLLARVERISKDSSALPQVLELFKVIERLGQAGYLKELDDILQKLPRGKNQQLLLSGLYLRLDKLFALLQSLLSEKSSGQ